MPGTSARATSLIIFQSVLYMRMLLTASSIPTYDIIQRNSRQTLFRVVQTILQQVPSEYIDEESEEDDEDDDFSAATSSFAGGFVPAFGSAAAVVAGYLVDSPVMNEWVYYVVHGCALYQRRYTDGCM